MIFQRIREAFHIFRLAYVLGAIAIMTLVLYPWLAASSALRYREGERLIPVAFHRAMRAVLGLAISVKGVPSSRRPLIIVANHTSWLDIIIISSFLPIVFVAKHEVASWPFFGWLAQLQRSIFVNRSQKQQIHQTIDRIADALIAGEIVGIFPEGTSTDGTDISPFRSALIGSVREAIRKAERLTSIFIQPVSIVYAGPRRRLAVWALEDEIPFFPHLLQVAGLRRIDVVLTWGEPIEANLGSDRKALTKRLEGAIRQLTAEAASGDCIKVLS
jgi:1-acyl-sn-glycerol-3-phosphate acyltransferase